MPKDTPLIEAVLMGDVQRVLSLITAETINAKGEFGKTALHNAVFFKTTRDGIVEALLNNGADLNAYDDNGHTPLSDAATNAQEINDVYTRRACKLIERGALWPHTDRGELVWRKLPEAMQQLFSEKLEAYQEQQKRLRAQENTKAFGMLTKYSEQHVPSGTGGSTTLRHRQSNTTPIELKKF